MKDNLFCKQHKKIFKIAQRNTKRFKKSIHNTYRDEFYLLEAYNAFSYELGSFLDKLIPQPEKPYNQFALLRIHEKAIKIFTEVIILMENGSASGAMARWRTLFELEVVAKVLLEYPELSEKFIMYSYVDTYKFYNKMYKYQNELNLVNYNIGAYADIEKAYIEVKDKYGWNGKNNFEWAKCDKVKNANLYELAKVVGLEPFYAYVDEAHMYNHSSTRYLFDDLGAKVDNNNYLFTPYELELPMQLIMSGLHQINCATILAYSDLKTADYNMMKNYLKENSIFIDKLSLLIKERIEKEVVSN